MNLDKHHFKATIFSFLLVFVFTFLAFLLVKPLLRFSEPKIDLAEKNRATISAVSFIKTLPFYDVNLNKSIVLTNSDYSKGEYILSFEIDVKDFIYLVDVYVNDGDISDYDLDVVSHDRSLIIYTPEAGVIYPTGSVHLRGKSAADLNMRIELLQPGSEKVLQNWNLDVIKNEFDLDLSTDILEPADYVLQVSEEENTLKIPFRVSNEYLEF